MTPERWQRINELYHDALELDRNRRATFLNEACGGDAALHGEVESLIQSHDQAGSFIAESALKMAARALAEDRVTSMAGRTFSHYRIESLLGVGGMGAVYLAEDTQLERKVAVKILNATILQQESNLDRFIQEAKAASALNHPNILVIHEIGLSEEAPYIVSEFVKGKTLRQSLSESSLTLPEVLDISMQIANALCAAHEAHLVHCDIKPENIVVRPDGYVKILDFGLAKLVTPGRNEPAKRAIVGTVNYMSPEQVRGEPVDERTDIFSLGVMIHEMIIGRTPFAGASISDTVANVIGAEPPPLAVRGANLPDEWQRIIRRMLQKDRDRRYRTMRELLGDLKKLKENLRLQRARPLATFAVAAFLVAALGLGYYFVRTRQAAARPSGGRSIAVLPLMPANGVKRDELYEIGVADSLILKLNSMDGLNARPLSAIRKYADKGQDPIVAGHEQKVDYVLASHYQLVRGNIRVTAQLLDVATGRVDRTYATEKDAANVFAMQEAIASELAGLLGERFGTTSSRHTVQRGTNNEEAYRLYLQGMYLNGKRNRADAQKAIEVLTQAVRLDPQYARAWAGKAHAHRTNLGGSNAQAEYQKSVEAVNRALALDPNLAEAHSVVCDNKMSYEWDFEGAGRECERAIELDPNSSLAHLNYSRYLNAQGRFEAAIDEAKTAIDLEPSSLVSQRHYGTCLYYARRYPEAVKQFERVIAMDKTFGTTYNWIIVALEMQGNHAEAYEWFMKARAVNYPDQKEITEAYQDAYARSGWHGMLLEQIRRTEDSKSETPRPEHKGVMQPPVYFQSAVLYAKVGNKDKAFEDLEKSYQRREMWITLLKVEPGLDSLRSDSRFDGLVKRVGLK